MYLYKSTYIGANWEHREVKASIDLTIGEKQITHIKPNRISTIEEMVMVWRKANQIHGWFVQNCQDGVDNCARYCVSREQLEELLDTCKRVEVIISKSEKTTTYVDAWDGGKVEKVEKAKYHCEEEIAELLPPTPGFFFGNYEIDDWYLGDIQDTIEGLTKLLSEDDESVDYYYQSSW